jgi:hypothetical protein
LQSRYRCEVPQRLPPFAQYAAETAESAERARAASCAPLTTAGSGCPASWRCLYSQILGVAPMKKFLAASAMGAVLVTLSSLSASAETEPVQPFCRTHWPLYCGSGKQVCGWEICRDHSVYICRCAGRRPRFLPGPTATRPWSKGPRPRGTAARRPRPRH